MSNLSDKIKLNFFQAAVVSILLYGCTTWMLTKRIKKKLNGNYTKMFRATSNKTWKQHHTKQQLYGHLPSLSKTIQIKRTRHKRYCWRSNDELISDVLLLTSHTDEQVLNDQLNLRQLCTDIGCCLEDLPVAIDDRDE